MILCALVPLKSSFLHSAGYCAEDQRLAIRFKSGWVSFWAPVPPQIFQGLMAAESAGKFFHHEIKGKFKKDRAAIVPRADTQEPQPVKVIHAG